MSEVLTNPEARYEQLVPENINLTTFLDPAGPYPERITVPDAAAKWSVDTDYNPTYFVSPSVVAAEGIWAMPETCNYWDIPNNSIAFPSVERDEEGRQLNPYGRTGIAGRGLLGAWGANITLDGLITRQNDQGHLQLLVIERGDNGMIAIPGGFADKDEGFENGARREVAEETGVMLPDEQGFELFKGLYLPSSRVTDHAWIETNVYHWNLEGDYANQVPKGMDDALDAKWETITQRFLHDLLPSHRMLLESLMARPS